MLIDSLIFTVFLFLFVSLFITSLFIHFNIYSFTDLLFHSFLFIYYFVRSFFHSSFSFVLLIILYGFLSRDIILFIYFFNIYFSFNTFQLLIHSCFIAWLYSIYLFIAFLFLILSCSLIFIDSLCPSYSF